MARRSLILLADLALDFLTVVIFLYLFSQGYFTNLDNDELNSLFFKIGIIGLLLLSITLYILLKKE